jgi:hypothetical protein
VRTLLLRRLVFVEERGEYRPVLGSEKILGYYANSSYL